MPFVVGDDPNQEKFKVRDVALPRDLTDIRFGSRTNLRAQIDKMVRINDEAAGDPLLAFDAYFQQGHDLVTSPEAQKAFDIEQESPEIRSSYGRNGFGQRCLLARRLVEAGVPFVTVYDGGWDHHSDIFGALRKRLPDWDNSVAALIRDLKERGLLETTLVVALGEFGRTPKLSTLPGSSTSGRDHWANAMSVLMAGGGTPGALSWVRRIGRGFRQLTASSLRRISSPRFITNWASIPARSCTRRKVDRRIWSVIRRRLRS